MDTIMSSWPDRSSGFFIPGQIGLIIEAAILLVFLGIAIFGAGAAGNAAEKFLEGAAKQNLEAFRETVEYGCRSGERTGEPVSEGFGFKENVQSVTTIEDGKKYQATLTTDETVSVATNWCDKVHICQGSEPSVGCTEGSLDAGGHVQMQLLFEDTGGGSAPDVVWIAQTNRDARSGTPSCPGTCATASECPDSNNWESGYGCSVGACCYAPDGSTGPRGPTSDYQDVADSCSGSKGQADSGCLRDPILNNDIICNGLSMCTLSLGSCAYKSGEPEDPSQHNICDALDDVDPAVQANVAKVCDDLGCNLDGYYTGTCSGSATVRPQMRCHRFNGAEDICRNLPNCNWDGTTCQPPPSGAPSASQICSDIDGLSPTANINKEFACTQLGCTWEETSN